MRDELKTLILSSKKRKNLLNFPYDKERNT